MTEDNPTEQKHDNIAMYFVYAAAAYFGITFLLKGSNKTSAAVINPYKVAEPPPITIVSANTQPTKPMVIPVIPKTPTISKPKPVSWIAEKFPLSKGMKGSNVKLLQQKLGVTADGAFGSNTEAALLRLYGNTTVSAALFQAIVNPAKQPVSKNPAAPVNIPVTKDTSVILKSGSKGADVYKLQKWLGFKDKQVAKKGELIADSIFGKQTLTALQKKTGQTFISIDQLRTLMMQSGGFINWVTGGKLGIVENENLITTLKPAIIFDENFQVIQAVPYNTVLGTGMQDYFHPLRQKLYKRFRTMDGRFRWVDKSSISNL